MVNNDNMQEREHKGRKEGISQSLLDQYWRFSTNNTEKKVAVTDP